jgi:hypothetical protein
LPAALAAILIVADTSRVQHSLAVKDRVSVLLSNTLLYQQDNTLVVAALYLLLRKTTMIFLTGQAKVPTNINQH